MNKPDLSVNIPVSKSELKTIEGMEKIVDYLPSVVMLSIAHPGEIDVIAEMISTGKLQLNDSIMKKLEEWKNHVVGATLGFLFGYGRALVIRLENWSEISIRVDCKLVHDMNVGEYERFIKVKREIAALYYAVVFPKISSYASELEQKIEELERKLREIEYEKERLEEENKKLKSQLDTANAELAELREIADNCKIRYPIEKPEELVAALRRIIDTASRG